MNRVMERIAARGEELNAFITLDPDAVDRARNDGPLVGVTVAVKDNIDTVDMRTTYGSAMYADRTPGTDASVVRRLRDAGAVIVGKTNLTELACGTIGLNERFGAVRNPVDPTRYAGGSSSGSAAIAHSSVVDLAIGSDTSCSIRQPAAMCGVYGLKPTFGRVPTDGVSVCSRHLDHVGPMSSTVEMIAAGLAVMQDPGWSDPVSGLGADLSGIRVGVLGDQFLDGCTPEIMAAHGEFLEMLRSVGCEVTTSGLDIDLVVADGHADALSADMLELYRDDVASFDGLVGEELRSWFSLYDGVDHDAYERGLEEQRRVRAVAAEVMTDIDVLVCPTTRVQAGPLDASDDEPRELRMGNCSIWAMTGQPSLSTPIAGQPGDLPIGMLLNGRHGEDDTVIALASALERLVRPE